jgi:tRNA A-37 threonylcarbamoyl transferase component Bud32
MAVTPDYAEVLTAAGLTDYDAVMTTRAGESLTKPGLGDRERIRLELLAKSGEAQTFYLKRYGTNDPASAEWDAVRAVHAAGVPTMQPVAMGTGPSGGFIIVTAVPGDALSRCMDDLLARHGDAPIIGSGLAGQLGRLAGSLHAAGLVHRDLYTDHIFAHPTDGRIDLYLIDLARVFHPQWRRWRWRVKDLAALKYSLGRRWTTAHWATLVDVYETTLGSPLPWWAVYVINYRVRRVHGHFVRRIARRLQQADHEREGDL